MDDVDAYYLGKACEWWDNRNPAEFYYNYTEDIENLWTERSKGRNQSGQPIEYTGYIRNIVTCCNPTEKKGKINTPNGLLDTKYLAKSRCKVCRSETTYVCSICGEYLYNEKYGRFCLDTHCEEKH